VNSAQITMQAIHDGNPTNDSASAMTDVVAGMPDAGPMPMIDAAPSPTIDAAPVAMIDAAPAPAIDAAMHGSDAGGTKQSDVGCGCSTGGARSSHGAFAILLFAVLLVARRRRP
jgi:MYXO-CTERM domain-containing protein